MYISVSVHLCAHPSQAAEGMNVPPQKQCYFIHDALSEAFGGMLCLQASLYSPSGSLQPLVCSYSGAVPMTLLSHMCATAGRPLFCCHRGLEGICLQIQLYLHLCGQGIILPFGQHLPDCSRLVLQITPGGGVGEG